MKKTLIFLIFSFIVGFGATAYSQATLHITINGLRNDNGQVILYLYNSETGYPKDHNKAFRIAVSTFTNNMCMMDIHNLPKGIYAIAFFHDENKNGVIDTNFLGLPIEGVGSSENGTGSIGPPTFNGSKFELKGNLSMTLKTKYFF